MSHRLLSLPLVVIVLASLAAPASATSPTPASGATWNPNQYVEYRWRAGDEPPAWMRAAVNAAAQDSNSSRASRAAVLAYASDGPAWVAYTGDLPSTWAIGYAVRHIPNSFNVRLRPQGYPLDWGTMRWCQFYDDPPNGCFDAELIALHEFGHVQTLGHIADADVTEWNDTIMHPASKTKAKTGWNMHEYGRCDVARLQIRYEPANPSTRISTCLDLPTELSFSSSSSSTRYYGTVTLSARLKIDADAIYPNLAAYPLAARKVLLQRRAPGTSSWTVVTEMDPVLSDPGRYVSSVTIGAVYDWRAVFTAPANEGLRGSASQAVRVSLSYDCAPTRLFSRHAPAQAVC